MVNPSMESRGQFYYFKTRKYLPEAFGGSKYIKGINFRRHKFSRVLIFAGINFRESTGISYFAGINFREFSRICLKFRELIPTKINTRENLCRLKLIPLM